MNLLSTTIIFIQKGDDGCESLLASVKLFCKQHQIDIPEINGYYTKVQNKSRYQVNKSLTTMEYYFRFDIFTTTIVF